MKPLIIIHSPHSTPEAQSLSAKLHLLGIRSKYIGRFLGTLSQQKTFSLIIEILDTAPSSIVLGSPELFDSPRESSWGIWAQETKRCQNVFYEEYVPSPPYWFQNPIAIKGDKFSYLGWQTLLNGIYRYYSLGLPPLSHPYLRDL